MHAMQKIVAVWIMETRTSMGREDVLYASLQNFNIPTMAKSLRMSLTQTPTSVCVY